MKLIDKDALVAEIERLKNTSLEYGYNTMQKVLADSGKDLVLGQLLHNLDTLEVKEVDLEKTINDYFKDWSFDEELDIMVRPDNYSATFDDIKEVAKYFFKLGLKAQKGK